MWSVICSYAFLLATSTSLATYLLPRSSRLTPWFPLMTANMLSDSDDPWICTADDSTPSRSAHAPFDKPEADVVLQTSDGVDLRVFRWILKDCLPIFADMFTLPPPPSTDTRRMDQQGDGFLPASNDDAPAIIKVSEDSATLETLLRMYYPLPPVLTFANFDSAKPVLIASDKYRLEGAMPQIINALLPHIRANPLRAYAFAVHCNMHDLVRVAARAFLAVLDTAVYSEELEDIPAGAYQRLMAYRKACWEAVDALFHSGPWRSQKEAWCWYSCGSCVSHGQFCLRRQGCRCGIAPWFTAYWNKVRALMKITPSSEVVDDPDLIEVKELYKCVYCCSREDRQQRRRYVKLLVAEVDRRIANVVLEIK
ncbi:hypothetical protein C8Q76DRAFT_340024 [Earliella scabrosa]|nr:hypothetical protein C8Q76DRAFT_340024 [Earliella scabrosa]